MSDRCFCGHTYAEHDPKDLNRACTKCNCAVHDNEGTLDTLREIATAFGIPKPTPRNPT